jgi:hypothetical protein
VEIYVFEISDVLMKLCAWKLITEAMLRFAAESAVVMLDTPRSEVV